MKRFMHIAGIVLLAGAVTISFSQAIFAQNTTQKTTTNTAHGRTFIDKNGDGYNDLAADFDGDGIPNGQDPDFVRQGNGRGNGLRGYVDQDGDGINDWAQDHDGDGIMNGQDPDYVKPKDGSGRKLGLGNRGISNKMRWMGQLDDHGKVRGIRGRLGTGLRNGTLRCGGNGSPN